MALVSDILQEIQWDVLEDNGLTTGTLAQADVIGYINDVLIDFLRRTGMFKRIYTVTVNSGVGAYTIPDDLMEVQDCFIGGVRIEHSNTNTISRFLRNWRRAFDDPHYWYEDGLPIKTVGLAPPPAATGGYLPGPNEPDPPHAQYGDWGGTTIDGYQKAYQLQDLTMVGTQLPTLVSAPEDTIPLVSDEWSLGFLVFGVLDRIFSDDSELKDLARAQFARQQYETGVALGKAISASLESAGTL